MMMNPIFFTLDRSMVDEYVRICRSLCKKCRSLWIKASTILRAPAGISSRQHLLYLKRPSPSVGDEVGLVSAEQRAARPHRSLAILRDSLANISVHTNDYE
jgi:hypothetical protein